MKCRIIIKSQQHQVKLFFSTDATFLFYFNFIQHEIEEKRVKNRLYFSVLRLWSRKSMSSATLEVYFGDFSCDCRRAGDVIVKHVNIN